MARKAIKKPSRKAQDRRSAALKGWKTRRAAARARSEAAKLGWKKRKAIKGKKPGRPPKRDVMHLVTLKFKTRAGRGEPLRSFKRDLLIPAPPGATFKELLKIAEETLPIRSLPLLQHFTRAKVTIAPGPKTSAKKAKER